MRDFESFASAVFPSEGARYGFRRRDGIGEFLLYDAVSPIGVNAHHVCRDLGACSGEGLVIRLHCPGGDAPDAIATYNALQTYSRTHGAAVTVVIDGYALSAGSILAMAGTETVMAPNAQMMIHEIEGFAYGRPTKLREIADEWEAMNEAGAAIYAARTGLTQAAALKLMTATTWLTAEEAVKRGFADRIMGDGEFPNYPLAKFKGEIVR